MKKLFKLMLITALLTLLENPVFASPSDPYGKEVDIRDATNPHDPVQERSILPTCQVFVNNQVEILFNKYIGEVSVIIVNQMGTVISSGTFNSDFEFSGYLQKPTGKGVYSIYILGSTGYQGTGEFTLN